MNKIPYDASRKSLYHPGAANDFFQFDLPANLSDPVLCAEMSRLAYATKLPKLKKYLGFAGYEYHWSVGYESNGTQLFIAKTKLDTGKLKIVIAFRGTEPNDILDMLADAFLFKTTWHDVVGNPLGKVHHGFANALLEDVNNGNVLLQIKQQLEYLAGEIGVILITGHSLGAALATLTGSFFNHVPFVEKIHTYTFGCPRVGDNDFSTKILATAHDRYVDCCDVVAQIPLQAMDYYHVGNFHYIDRFGAITDAASEDSLAEIIAKDRSIASKAYFIKHLFGIGAEWFRRLADHSPINYLSGVSGLRTGL